MIYIVKPVAQLAQQALSLRIPIKFGSRTRSDNLIEFVELFT